MGVDQLVVGHPQRVRYALYAFKMMYVPGSDDEFDVDGLGHLPHCLRYRLLVIVAVAPQVISKIEIERSFKSLPFFGAVCRHCHLPAGNEGCGSKQER